MSYRAGTTAERIRYGLTGLAVAFLVILLGSIVSHSGGDANSAATQAAEAEESKNPKEPLAELGVAPGSEASENAANAKK